MVGYTALLLAALSAIPWPPSSVAPPEVRPIVPMFDLSMLTKPDRRVRTTDARVEHLLLEGVTRSRTFAGLVATLNHTDVIVYIEMLPNLPRSVAGRLLLLPLTASQRYLRIQITREPHARDAIALIGHELRHALEIASVPHVRNQRDMIRLYEEIGQPNVGLHSYDTVEAQLAGRQVRAELAG